MTALSDLPTQLWLDFFSELEECAVLDVCLTGGEVFTRRDLLTLVDSIVSHKMRFSILTNGTLITQPLIEHMVDTGRLRSVQISIDSSVGEIHDRNRGKGSFEAALRGVDIAMTAGASVCARVTLTGANIATLGETCNMLLERGIESFGVNDACSLGSYHSKADSEEFGLTIDQFCHAMEVLDDFDKKHPGIIGGQAGPLTMLRFLRKAESCLRSSGDSSSLGLGNGYLCGCNCVFDKLAVLHDGRYVPCNMLPDLTLGHVGTDRLVDVWTGSPILQQMRHRHEIPLTNFESCRECSYRTVCTGSCPASEFAVSGQLNVPNRHNCFQTISDYLKQAGRYDYVTT